MAAPTSSSRRARNVRAGASVVVGLAGLAVLPAAIAAAEVLGRIELIEAGYAVPVAAALAIAALLLARGARLRTERTLGRVGGRRTTWLGGALGVVALAVAASGAIALLTYEVLGRLAE